MNSVIKGAGYVLVHTPEMVVYNGTTQTTERVVNPESEYLKELMIGKHLDYMKEHNLYLNGDIIGIVITKVRDSGKNVIYMLMSLPFGKNDV